MAVPRLVSVGTTPGRIAFALGSASQRLVQFQPQFGEIPLNPAFTTDQNMIGTGNALLG